MPPASHRSCHLVSSPSSAGFSGTTITLASDIGAQWYLAVCTCCNKERGRVERKSVGGLRRSGGARDCGSEGRGELPSPYAPTLLRSSALYLIDLVLDEAFRRGGHDVGDGLPDNSIAEPLEDARHDVLDHLVSDHERSRRCLRLRLSRSRLS